MITAASGFMGGHNEFVNLPGLTTFGPQHTWRHQSVACGCARHALGLVACGYSGKWVATPHEKGPVAGAFLKFQ